MKLACPKCKSMTGWLEQEEPAKPIPDMILIGRTCRMCAHHWAFTVYVGAKPEELPA